MQDDLDSVKVFPVPPRIFRLRFIALCADRNRYNMVCSEQEMNEEEFSSQITQKINFRVPRSNVLPEYQLDSLTTEL